MKLDPNKIKYLVVHCSATQATQMIGASEINQMHVQRGFDGIGYHFIIRRNPNSTGGIIELGRPITDVGAHVKGHNSESLGICLIGGITQSGAPEANFTPQQYQALYWILNYLRTMFPKTSIVGHRDFPDAGKSCPCFDVTKW
jgi:N-acetylmuramoyl-L-alanine amidase